jgi:hypothetical protein
MQNHDRTFSDLGETCMGVDNIATSCINGESAAEVLPDIDWLKNVLNKI